MQPSVDTSIVIPAFDEAERLPRTLDQLMSYLSRQPEHYEVLLSDDGSSDDTVAVFERHTRGASARVVRSPKNCGKGHAVRLGMLAARGTYRVMMDADGSMPASELGRLLEPMRRGVAPVVIGSRYLDGRGSVGQPRWRRVWSRLVHAIVKRTLVPDIHDTHCGYKAFSAAAADAIFGRATLDGWSFDLEVLALAQHLDLRVLEVSVEWTDDRRSRVRPLHDLRQTIGETLRIRSNLRRQVYRVGER
jgi:dolichyl-phosphate beta-glucosyltransferase